MEGHGILSPAYNEGSFGDQKICVLVSSYGCDGCVCDCPSVIYVYM